MKMVQLYQANRFFLYFHMYPKAWAVVYSGYSQAAWKLLLKTIFSKPEWIIQTAVQKLRGNTHRFQ